MLIVSRRAKQRLFLGQIATILVDEARGRQTRLRIEAPRELLIEASSLAQSIEERIAGWPHAAPRHEITLVRRAGEGILLGDAIAVWVTRIRKGTVRLAIVAPRELRIRREEEGATPRW